MSITAFTGQWRFLSNFWPCRIEFDGDLYPSVEHAYQAAKTTSVPARANIARAATPGDAKRMGRLVDLRPGWDEMKIGVMHSLLKSKFRDPELRRWLQDTGTQELIEGNYWGDTFWGVCHGSGQNHLGRLLMEIRAEGLSEEGK